MDFPQRPHQAKSRTPRRFSADGEALVARLLERQGWTILARNFRHVGCELDIVAQKGRSVVAVEVKTRRANAVQVDDLLPHRKRAALTRGLTTFTQLRALDCETMRLDLAIVRPGGVAYYVNV